MRIGIDMLAVQSAGRARGTGRYARSLVAELLRDAQHDWYLYDYDGLPVDDLHSTFESRTGREASVTRRRVPAEASLHTSASALLRSNADDLDLLLLTCPLENFQGYLPPFPSRGRTRLAALIYDLIPLRFPQHYLCHAGIAAAYRRALAAVRQYDALLTISQSCRSDVIELLRVDSERVIDIGAGGDADFFHPPASATPDAASSLLLSSQGVGQPYIYSLTALDFRKNLAGLLAAFERLPERLLKRHCLVLTCAASGDGDRSELKAILGRSPVAERIVFTGPLEDRQLRTLYQYAAAFVFPSRYEGFGLPLLEAMLCGAPIIAGDNSSQSELVGEAGLLVDVNDVSALSQRLAELLDDPSLAERLGKAAAERARASTWTAVGGRCLQALDVIRGLPPNGAWWHTLAARGKLALENRWDRYARRGERVSA